MKALLISFLLMNSVFAADCVIGNGDQAITVRDAEKVSLFDAGKSLSTHRVQDQDGLGTCYANTASVVLKSVLPGNPDVSYTQAALEANTRGVSPHWSEAEKKFMRKEGDKIVDVTSGGFTCRTVDALRQAGGACPANRSILENKQLIDPNVQERLMRNMGTYFDDMNAIQSDPEEAQKYKEQLAIAVQSLNAEKTRLLNACNDEKNSQLPVTGAMKRMIGMELLELKGKPCAKEKMEAFQRLLPGSSIQEDRNTIVLTDEIVSKLQDALKKDSSLKGIVARFVAGSNITSAERSLAWNKLGKMLSDFLKQNVTSPELTACANGPYISTLPDIVTGNTFLSNMKNQKQINCDSEITNQVVLSSAKTAESNQCIPPARLEVIMDAISPLMEIGSALDPSVLNTLTNPLATYGNQLKQILAPACQSRSNLIPMNDVSCKTYSTCQERDLGSIYAGPANGCTTLPEAKKVIGRQIISGIKQGRALGIDVCTAFMKDPSVTTGFCKRPAPGVEGHRYHAMAVSGYRCVAGKMEYEILNSWGKESCPSSQAQGFKNSAVECVLDSNGRPTGKFWAKEDVLIDNTQRINDVSNGNP